MYVTKVAIFLKLLNDLECNQCNVFTYHVVKKAPEKGSGFLLFSVMQMLSMICDLVQVY